MTLVSSIPAKLSRDAIYLRVSNAKLQSSLPVVRPGTIAWSLASQAHRVIRWVVAVAMCASSGHIPASLNRPVGLNVMPAKSHRRQDDSFQKTALIEALHCGASLLLAADTFTRPAPALGFVLEQHAVDDLDDGVLLIG